MNNIIENTTTINNIQSTKIWKIVLTYRRFVAQIIKGDIKEKKDFFKWMSNKIFKSKYNAKVLRDFDLLENVKNDMEKIPMNLINENVEFDIVKRNKHIFIFGGVPYYDIGGGQRSAQFAKIFNKMGYCVDYIYAYESNEFEQVKVVLPTNSHTYLNNITPQDIIKNIKGEPIFIFEIPHKDFQPYLELAKKIKASVVYEHIDNWETQLGSLFFDEDIFKDFLVESDIVIATSQLLKEKLQDFVSQRNLPNIDIKYLANAVDSDLFDPNKSYDKPDDLKLGRKTLIYYGSLWGDWFEWDKIIYVAEQLKDCSINIIGDYGCISDKIKEMPKNIHFLGLKQQCELPAYLYNCDFALLPFKNDDIGKYVSPLKIFEYICMNKFVISTKLPDILGYPNVLSSDKKEEWVEFINNTHEKQDCEEFICSNNWYSRCENILDSIEDKKDKKVEKISIIILNRNNKNVIKKCIDNILKYSEKYNYEIIIVDNDSTDGSYEMLLEKYKNDNIKIIKNSKNGCSSGRNLGVKESHGDTIVFLDSDQWPLHTRWLDIPREIINNNPNIGAIGWAAGWFDKKQIAGVIGEYLPNKGVNPGFLFRTDIGYLGTGGMVLKRSIFDEVEGFDEAFDPTCYEDTDFSLKIRNEGYELAYCPYIGIKHLPHQTTKSGSKEHSRLLQKNGKYFFGKWQEKNPALLEYYYI